jgi:hypothetical protein
MGRVGSLRTDYNIPFSGSTIFNGMWIVKVGGNLDTNNNIINYFNGIIAGVFINGHRVLDLSIDGHRSATCRGDCKIAPHRFNLPPPRYVEHLSETEGKVYRVVG